MEIVDAQIHLWRGSDAPPHHRQQPFLAEDALAEMDAAGVDRAVNCPAIWDLESVDYAVEVAERFPDRFATLGWFPLEGPPDPGRVGDLLGRTGMLGLRFVIATPELIQALVSGSLDWLWAVADDRELPVGLMVLPEHLPLVDDIARRFPSMRLLVDHLAVLPFFTLPEAGEHIEELLALAARPNIAVKATGVPSMATDPYPFVSTHPILRRVVDAFGPARVFWGTDITRLSCTWRECVTMFTEELPWLAGSDLDQVMGAGLRSWIGWA